MAARRLQSSRTAPKAERNFAKHHFMVAGCQQGWIPEEQATAFFAPSFGCGARRERRIWSLACDNRLLDNVLG